MGCASGSGGMTVDDKVGEGDKKDARESSPQPVIRLRGGKVTGRNEVGRMEMGRKRMRTKETGGKETGVKETGTKETGEDETGGKATGAKAQGAQYNQETSELGDMLMGEREMGNMLVIRLRDRMRRKGSYARATLR